MTVNAVLTSGVIAAAVVAGCLALRPAHFGSEGSDQTDALLNRPGRGWTEPTPITLDDAVAQLSKWASIRIVLDWPQLEAAGVSRKPGRLDTHGFNSSTVRTTLKHLVHLYSRTPMTRDLSPLLQFSSTTDGALLVSINHNAGHRLRIYDVRDLLSDDYWGVPTTPARARDAEKSRMDDLVTLLQFRMDPDDYQTLRTGDMILVNRMDPFAGRLLITTTSAEHGRIERILASLRRMNSNGGH